MNELIEQIYGKARGAWRFRWIAVGVATAVAIIGWLVVFAMPDKYEAKASVFVDTRTALKPVLQGLAVEEDVTSQLNYVRQSLLSGVQLEKIAAESGVLGSDVTDPRKKSLILAEFAEHVVITVRNASGRDNDRESGGVVYTFAYPDSKRERSLKVTDTVLKRFVDETLGGKRESSESTQKFLETQIKVYEQRLRAAENSLADFKKSNIGLMPTEQGGYFTELQTEIDAAKKAENDLNVAVSRRAELARQLRGEAVINASIAGTPVPGAAGGGSADTASRIKETQARLDDLLLRFTDRHPDVIAARAALVELKQRRDVEIQSLRRGDASAVAASGVSSNPVYQSIQLSLNQADVEIASLRGQLGQHQSKAADLRRRLDTAPHVEAQFAQLNRDYDINKAQYTALLANYEKTRLGEQAGDAGSVRFEIVQPPTASYVPVSPRRGLLLAGVLVGAMVVGGGVAYLLHLLSPVVSSVRELSELTGLPVLGIVSAAFPQQLHADARREAFRLGSAMACLLAAFVIAIALNHAGIRLALPAGGAG